MKKQRNGFPSPLWGFSIVQLPGHFQPETDLKRNAPLHSHPLRSTLGTEGKDFPE